MAKYQIRGEWTGPQSPAGDWTRLHHVEYVTDRTKRDREFIDACRELKRIVFTDGTALIIDVYDVTGVRRSKLPDARRGYGRLVRRCIKHGVNRVEDLPRETG